MRTNSRIRRCGCSCHSYFVHERYAGLSAFVNEAADASERNALMLAVGVLVPLSYGRLGRSWRHAQDLKDLARYGILPKD